MNLKNIVNKSLLSMLLCSSAAYLFSACSDNSFKVDGKITDAADKSLVLERGFNGKWIELDSVGTANDGSFSLKFEAPQSPEIYRLRMDERYVYFPIDSLDHITITSDFKKFGSDYTLAGSEQAVMMMNFEHDLNKVLSSGNAADLTAFKRDVFNKYIKGSNAGILSYYILTKTIEGKYLFDPNDKFDMKIYTAVATAYKQFKPNDPRAQLLETVALNAQRKKNKDAGLQRVVEAEEVALIDIELKDISGKIRKLSDATKQGKPTVVIFSVLSDEKSPEMNREIAKIYETGTNIYHVCLDYDQLAWKKAASNLPWIVVYDPSGANSQYLLKYNVTDLPAAYIYDRNGSLSAKATSLTDLRRLLSSM